MEISVFLFLLLFNWEQKTHKRETQIKGDSMLLCYLIIKLCIGSITKESTLLLLLKVIHFIQQRQTKIPILFSFNFSSTNSNWKHMSSYVIFASMQKVSINLIIVCSALLVLAKSRSRILILWVQHLWFLVLNLL